LNKKASTFELAGGIGNQLFQFFAGLSFAIQTSRDLEFDISRLGKGTSKRKENVLDDVSLIGPGSIEFTIVTSSVPRFIDSVVYRSKIAAFFESKLRRIFTSNVIGYDETLFIHSDRKHFRGYFQTYNYFNRVINSGISILFNESSFSTAYHNYVRTIDFENDVAVHIRRGDYLDHTDSIGLLDARYFLNGLAALKPRANVYVFSDEKLPFFQFSDQFSFVETTNMLTERPIESLVLMSKFRNIVISNSTFSWWSAILGLGQKNVVCPFPWFRNMSQPIDLIPDFWVLVNSEWVGKDETN
jgi:hypothetical protein